MLGLLIVVIGGIAGCLLSRSLEWGLFWDICTTFAGALLCWIVLSIILRKLIAGKQAVIQEIMLDTQRQVDRQTALFQYRPPSSMNAARQTMEKIQFAGIRKALEATELLKPFYPWNFLLSRQTNTMKAMLYYQLREYKKCDELLKKALLLDIQSIAIKMARDYRNKEAKLDKFYLTHTRRFKGNDAAFLACVYAWIKLKQEDTAAALQALRRAAESSDHPVLTANIDHLVNGKFKHFSNSGFGDQWYALALEEPKIKPQKRAF